MMNDMHLRLGEVLIDAGVLQPEQLEKALALQKKRQLRLGTILLQEDFVSEPQLIQALSRRLSIPWVNLWHIDIPDELLDLVPVSVAEEFFLIPIYIRTTGDGEKSLYVAMNDPTDDSALRFVAAAAGLSVKPMIAGPSDISAAIRAYYYGEEEIYSGLGPVSPRSSSIPPPPPIFTSNQPPPPTPQVMRQVSAPPPPPAPQQMENAKTVEVPKKVPPPTPQAADKEMDTELREKDVSELITDADEKANAAEPAADAPLAVALEDDDDKQRVQREVEKHMFGVGSDKKRRALSMTLLDGTTIDFGGGAKKKPSSNKLTKDEFLACLKAAADDPSMKDLLPSDRWEDYMSTLLEILFRKHLVFFDEFINELKKNKD
ncbi:MAG: hypothetical protein GY847_17165 [Proteobacteria bacterium]|nr:hypothetical protein [Pseudomonadota bacterium]